MEVVQFALERKRITPYSRSSIGTAMVSLLAYGGMEECCRGDVGGRECHSKTFYKNVNRGRMAGKNPRVGNARREMRRWRWRRGGVGGLECLSKTFS